MDLDLESAQETIEQLKLKEKPQLSQRAIKRLSVKSKRRQLALSKSSPLSDRKERQRDAEREGEGEEGEEEGEEGEREGGGEGGREEGKIVVSVASPEVPLDVGEKTEERDTVEEMDGEEKKSCECKSEFSTETEE